MKLLKDKPLRTRLGEAALKKARDKFELSASANHYRMLYEELLEPRAGLSPRGSTSDLVIAR